ncbi:hypothetical protein DM01DRAFT_1281380 [Hesseltinella vesiculosa]|uniref:Uncharacterized protein n=1 Tax=Hesseltinella vesiculosa TaxID=101127 RepID=A0A1X2GS44_9FUNG|nr:hypothetical protein DM01DRAFT_1281380 [Hesseltinella vesiculosa]
MRVSHLDACPSKFSVWKLAWSHAFSSRPLSSPTDLINCLEQQQWPHPSSYLELVPPSLLFSSFILGIWRAHWDLIYHQVPFATSLVVTRISKIIDALHAETTPHLE